MEESRNYLEGGGNDYSNLDSFRNNSSFSSTSDPQSQISGNQVIERNATSFALNIGSENKTSMNRQDGSMEQIKLVIEKEKSEVKSSIESCDSVLHVKVKDDIESAGNLGKDPKVTITLENQAETDGDHEKDGSLNDGHESDVTIDFNHDEQINRDDAKSDSEVELNESLAARGEDVKISLSGIGIKQKGKKRASPSSMQTQMSKHPLLPPCQCNKRKCGEQFSYEMRILIHEKFWTMNMYDRREWTNEHLLYLKPKSRTNKPVSTLHESHRKFFLPNLSGKIEVCRRMFFSTLGFKDEAKFLQNPKHLNKQGMLSRTRKRKCIMSRKNLEAVEEYCKELREKHGSMEGPGTSAQVVIPSGFSLRDMYNDFCAKTSVSSFGYHKFRQILELILRGERVEDSQFADLRDDDEGDGASNSKRKKKSMDKLEKSKSEKGKPEKSKSEKGKPEKSKSEKNKTEKNIVNLSKPKKIKAKENKPKDRKKNHKKKDKNHSSKKRRTILKLPIFSEIKNNRVSKRKHKEAFSNSSAIKRYNFRDSITPVKTYCEDDMIEDAVDSEDDTFDGLISVTFEDNAGKHVEKQKSKTKVSKSKKCKENMKISKEVIKNIKLKKKKYKTPERLEQIKFAESRKKTGSNHPVLPPCKCNLRKCHEKISENQRHVIHDDFWKITAKQEKKKWVEKHVIHCKPRSRSSHIKFPRKHFFRRYYFPNEEGKMISICRVFFMRTLGYHSNMTIDSMDMVPVDVSRKPVESIDTIRKAAENENSNKDSSDKDAPFQQTSQDSSLDVCAEHDNANYKEEHVVDELNETTEASCFFGPKPEESAGFVYFTPEIEKEEIERAVNPNVRRRRPLSQRNSKEHHPMREPCTCAKKCLEKVPQDRREAIHEYYWSLITYNQRKQWILEHIKREVPKRRTVLNGPVRKKETRRCYLPAPDGSKVEVCRAFFLSTLGFKWDKMIDTICKTTPQDSKYVRADQRGKRAPVHKLQSVVLSSIKEYIESILQTIPYIPPQPRDPLKSGVKKKKNKSPNPAQGGLTIKTLYADYKIKHPNQKVSYASFRKVHCQVRDAYKAQNPVIEDEPSDDVETAPPLQQIPDSHPSDVSASPGSDNGFSYESNNAPPRVAPINSTTTITPLQSCMYNEQPQLLNLSHANNMSKSNHHNDVNRLGQPNDIKFSKPQDYHLIPFPAYDKAATKGQGMYQIPSHATTNIMPQYSTTQNNPLDSFYMASSSQAMSNPIAYSNLHFSTDLINHPHLHHPAHHHAHLYQPPLPYRDHNRFTTSVLPQALKEQDPNHHFYNHQLDYGQDHPHTGQDNTIYPFKDALSYQSFTPDNITHSPVPNQIPTQMTYPTNNVNIIEQRSSSSDQGLPASNFVENPNSNPCSVSSVKVSANEPLQFMNERPLDQFNQKSFKQNPDQKEKKKSSKKSKKADTTPKAPRVRKVRPLSNRNSKEHHPMLPPCTCGKKCSEKISQSQREVIYDAFWELGTYNNRKQWIAEHMKREDPKRRTNLEATVMRKKETRRFTLPNSSGEMVEVCRLFFLHTCGLKWDKMIGTICKTTARDEHTVPPDMRGKKPPAHKLNEEIARSVESYARALLQAAKPEYLTNIQQPDNAKKFTLDTFIPYGLNMKNLHQDYKAKHASHKVSYESFRKIFRQVRKVVLDPDSADVEANEAVSPETTPVDSDVLHGTINAATGHIDSAF